MTQSEVDAYLARQSNKQIPADFGKSQSVGLEHDLHDQIFDWLSVNRWFCVHSRMDCPTTVQPGVPDFICAAPDGVTYWIECKRKGKKLSDKQVVAKYLLEMNGHKHATIYSMADFLEFVKPSTERTQ